MDFEGVTVGAALAAGLGVRPADPGPFGVLSHGGELGKTIDGFVDGEFVG